MNNEANPLTAGVAVICGIACACAIWPDTVGATVSAIMMILLGLGSIAGLLWIVDLLPHRERSLPPLPEPELVLCSLDRPNPGGMNQPAGHQGACHSASAPQRGESR
ncbi:MAG: hypothetical protein M3443_06205 [Actinomycetota bacterium]|nr:hypothetical protein [Actinomycetota bacterium]